MKIKTIIRAAMLGMALAVPAQVVSAQVLTVMRGATASNITVATNRAVVMQSDRPFGELSVANPNIADIAPLGDSAIYVLGKVPGRTTLTLLSPEGGLIANIDVRVVPDIAEFKERLSEILPGEPIEVRTAANGIVLSGTVSGARKVARAMELARRYSENVTNLM
ncbi:MAG TPA: pilus assembly protein N-terminal domain-containing protein, partial [Paracoccaceae bacterium]|nr:pilus assembly protein N-terminal domain-containing protein [Paracoccaceae bacterium]